MVNKSKLNIFTNIESNLKMQPLEVYSFAKLFGTSKDGKTKEWEIRVERYDIYSEIVTLHGYTNKIESRRKIDKGKNLNKANATTHFTQAKLEAQSKWTKKHDIEMYKEEKPASKEEEVRFDTPYPESMNVPKLPMLAQEFNKHKSKVKYPCFVQPKLDGYRMIYDSTKRRFTTRQGKDFLAIRDAGLLFEELSSLPSGHIFDGELYVHGQSFESLGVLRKTKLTQKDKESLTKLEYHVYDMVSDQIFEERSNNLCKLITTQTKIKLVPTHKAKDENEIKEMHQKFISEGYEGTMVRNAKSKYLEKNRSYDLLKYKDFMDAEFEIVGYTFEKDTTGEDKNCVVWIVKIKDDITSKVRPRGERKQRQELFEECEKNFNNFKGRKLWTKFFEYTTDGSLRFPTTKTEDVSSYIRDEVL